MEKRNKGPMKPPGNELENTLRWKELKEEERDRRLKELDKRRKDEESGKKQNNKLQEELFPGIGVEKKAGRPPKEIPTELRQFGRGKALELIRKQEQLEKREKVTLPLRLTEERIREWEKVFGDAERKNRKMQFEEERQKNQVIDAVQDTEHESGRKTFEGLIKSLARKKAEETKEEQLPLFRKK